MSGKKVVRRVNCGFKAQKCGKFKKLKQKKLLCRFELFCISNFWVVSIKIL